MDQRRAEPEISEVRDRRRLDRTSANPPWPQASKQASKTRRGRGDALPDRAAQHCAARIDSRGRGVKLEWERIYLGGQGGRPDEGIRIGRQQGGHGHGQRAASERARCQPWFGSTLEVGEVIQSPEDAPFSGGKSAHLRWQSVACCCSRC